MGRLRVKEVGSVFGRAEERFKGKLGDLRELVARAFKNVFRELLRVFTVSPDSLAGCPLTRHGGAVSL